MASFSKAWCPCCGSPSRGAQGTLLRRDVLGPSSWRGETVPTRGPSATTAPAGPGGCRHRHRRHRHRRPRGRTALQAPHSSRRAAPRFSSRKAKRGVFNWPSVTGARKVDTDLLRAQGLFKEFCWDLLQNSETIKKGIWFELVHRW